MVFRLERKVWWGTWRPQAGYDQHMSFATEQRKIQKQGYSKESAGKILGAAAQKAKHPSAKQKKVLRAQGKKVK